MNNNISDFTFNNNFEFGLGRDYFKDEEEACLRPPQLVLSFSESCKFTHPFRFDEDCSSPREDEEQLHFFSAQQNDLMSLNSFNINDGPALTLDHTLSTGKTKPNSKRTCSNTNLSLSCAPEEEIYCKEISQFTDKEADECANIVEECANKDLNQVVDKLLTSTAVDYLKDQGIEVDDQTAQMLSVNKRKRKTKSQIQFLEAEYAKNSEWTKEYMKKLAEGMNISPSSIYKWHWDQKNKRDAKPARVTKKTRKGVAGCN